jgi:hypothetical protein
VRGGGRRDGQGGGMEKGREMKFFPVTAHQTSLRWSRVMPGRERYHATDKVIRLDKIICH